MDSVKNAVLVGYPESQKIVPITKTLLDKYVKGVNFTFLNHTGEIGAWSLFVRKHLETLADKYIIFALDDYLVAKPFKISNYLPSDPVVCIRLGESDFFTENPTNEKYCCSTQFSIWNREYLIRILKETSTPWDFELTGSQIMRKDGKYSKWFNPPPMVYCGESALSKRQPGKVSIKGLDYEDIVLVLNEFKKEALIVGQPQGREADQWQDI